MYMYICMHIPYCTLYKGLVSCGVASETFARWVVMSSTAASGAAASAAGAADCSATASSSFTQVEGDPESSLKTFKGVIL
jgi:hypothetical protein